MHRIDTKGRQRDKFGTGKDGYSEGTLAVTHPTLTDAAAFDAVQEEILSPIEATGLVPTKGTNTQLRQAIQGFFQQVGYLNITERANPKAFDLYDVAYSSTLGMWIAVGQADGTDSYIVKSYDTVTWTEVAPTVAVNVNLRAVHWNGSMFVAVGHTDGTGYIIYSTNGTTWTRAITAKNFNLYDVTYGGGVWIAVGAADGVDAYMLRSTNGIDWTEIANPKNFLLDALAYEDGVFIAVGESDGVDAYLVKSTDLGLTWSEKANPKAFNVDGLEYANGMFIGVGGPDGTDAYMIKSVDDGDTWTEVANSQNAWLHCVMWYGVWVAVGADYCLYSLDGVTWAEFETPKTDNLEGICRGQNRWVSVGMDDGADAYILSSTYKIPEIT